jgi:hypothetical protein
MRTRRALWIVLAAVVAAAAAASVPAGAASPAAPVFGHEVVIDHQRSGFEPDIVVTSKNVLYSSVPNGSSQAHSFIWNSLDGGQSWQLIPGQFGFGKPLTCPQGGGDTELQRDAGDNLYLSDLQNLSNLSNAVSTDGGKTFNFSCTSAPNTPVDRMWYASHGKLGDPDFAIYEEYDAVLSNTNPSNLPGNQLVEIVSHDGANFTPVINSNPSVECLGGGAINCVTNEEGLPGNQILNSKGELVIAHSGNDGNSVFVSIGKPTTTGTGQAAVTTATWQDIRVNGDVCPDKSSSAPGICGSTNFPTIAQDTAGNLYLVNSAQGQGADKGPYNVYVNVSKDAGHTWGPSIKVSKDGSNAFPWITAGSSGRVAVAWYHANEESEKNDYTFDGLEHAEFSVQVAQSIDALAATPHYSVVTATEHPMKYGPICTAGTACAVTMGDRSLGDYLNLGVDQDGGLALVYVDDTSNSFTTGPTGAIAENGPPVYQKQIGGPTMIAGRTPHGSLPVNTISDVTGDTNYSANGARTPAGDNLDLTGATVAEDATGLVITMKLKSLESLAVDPLAGGTTGTWITRFTTYNPGTPGNGHIYYAGMESLAGGEPRFFDGDVAGPNPAGVQISMVFDSAKAITGKYDPHGTITLHVPFADIPGAKRGQKLYSATAFAGTTVGSLSGNPAGVINVTDSTAPFNHVVGAAAAPVTPVAGPAEAPGGSAPGGSAPPPSDSLAATGLGVGLPLVGLALLIVALVVRRRRTT